MTYYNTGKKKTRQKVRGTKKNTTRELTYYGENGEPKRNKEMKYIIDILQIDKRSENIIVICYTCNIMH